MVTRKPLPEKNVVDDTKPVEPPRIEIWSATDSEVDSEQIWGAQEQTPSRHDQTDKHESADTTQQVPDPLRPGFAPVSTSYAQDEPAPNPWTDGGKEEDTRISEAPKPKLEEVPIVLRPGVARSETNPFKRKPLESSSGALSSTQKPNKPPTIAPAPVPAPAPIEAFTLPRVDESPDRSTNPWQPALDVETDVSHAQRQPPLFDQNLDGDIWGSRPPSKSASPKLTPTQGDAEPIAPVRPAPLSSSIANDQIGDENAWEDEKSNTKGKQPAEYQSEAPPETIDGWNLVELELASDPTPGTLSKRSTWENFDDAESDTAKEVAPNEIAKGAVAPETAKEVVPSKTDEAPALPPRTSAEVPPPQPPRRPSPNNVNMSETYQIKNINWHDSKAAKNPRKSPILVQNANGPCPLVALVNALTLTTPADQGGTNLVEALGSREQISLSLLLEVVVDELMSCRHIDSGKPLPDMSELYGFLQGLHTGMNVNPRFIPGPEAIAAYERTLPSSASPSETNVSIPGTFENTRDMELYATFRIPLIHGWLPPKGDEVYEALKTQASSYDDAQNLLFHEEELEYKFSNSEAGLTEEEQQLYQDIIVIKSFLSTTATQLTPSGLDVITKFIKPGDVSILFRNDHFSTLYRHPQTLQLFTLVTDAGYYTHDEVVWESLADVRGERAEFFSGDFRVVGGNHPQRAGSSDDAWYGSSNTPSTSNGGAWQTVPSRRSRSSRQSEPASSTDPVSPKHEQEDRDLALALQLQEEEEERHRAEQAARRRESRLSEQYIEQQGRDGDHTSSRRGGSISSASRGSTHSLPPPRSSSASQPARAAAPARGGRPAQQVRSLIPPRTHRPAEEGLDEAPPSYEQAARSTPYLPPAGHPSHPESEPRTPPNPNPRRSSTMRSQSNAGPSLPARPRQSAPSVSAGGSSGAAGKDRDCVVM